jgi:hypothetical protein
MHPLRLQGVHAMTRVIARAISGVLMLAVVVLTAMAILASTGYASTRAGGGRVPACKTIAACHRAIAWQARDRAHLRHQLAVKVGPVVQLGYELARGLYHVDLHRLGYCESTNDPYAQTGQYRGITQQGRNFMARNRDVYRLLPVTNAIANILVAARHIARYGASEWQCRLDGSVKHGGAYS